MKRVYQSLAGNNEFTQRYGNQGLKDGKLNPNMSLPLTKLNSGGSLDPKFS